MNTQIPQEVLNAFILTGQSTDTYPADRVTVKQIGNGLINHSWKVECEYGQDIFLQQINKTVFLRPESLQENYLLLSQYNEFEFSGLRMPAPAFWSKKSTLYTDRDQNYWRAFEFISEGIAIDMPQNPEQAKAAAGAFAKFTASFDELDVRLLKEVIPGFHNLLLRYNQFEDSLKTELYERMATAMEVITQLKNRKRYIHFYETITGSAGFRRRVMHHDAKISNLLFHEQTGKVICPVDYDTVMPGYFFSDLGDMIRSMAGNASESQKNPDDIFIRKDFYEAIITGYTDVLGGQLSFSEKKYIHSAGLLMIYMQALRFMSDYLNGDIYYKTEYPGQNFDRAANQLALLKSLEEFLDKEYKFKI